MNDKKDIEFFKQITRLELEESNAFSSRSCWGKYSINTINGDPEVPEGGIIIQIDELIDYLKEEARKELLDFGMKKKIYSSDGKYITTQYIIHFKETEIVEKVK